MKNKMRELILVLGLVAGFAPAAQAAEEVVVYKSPTCGCCNKWIEHLQANGFSVKAQNVADVMPYKNANGVPPALASCHTAKVGGYVIEGHVPADDIKRLLKERPKVLGLSVPGMPIGSPGMEQGAHKEKYDVLSFDSAGKTGIFSKR